MKPPKSERVNKRVVFLSSRFPLPIDKGDKLRVYHHIKEVSQYADVILVCLYEDSISKEDIRAMSSWCHQIHAYKLPTRWRKWGAIKALLTGRPMQVGYFYHTAIKRRIHSLLDDLQPDHIHCHLVRMAPYVAGYVGSRTSLDYMDSLVLNDMASQHIPFKWLGWLRSVERHRIKAYEQQAHSFFLSHFIISRRDLNCIAPKYQEDIMLLSNGVTLSEVAPKTQEKQDYDICFCGNLGYMPNQTAIEYIIRELWSHLKELKIVIAGADAPPSLWRRLPDGVALLSPVQDMGAIYRSSRILLAPIYHGSGQQNKILEAMSYGVPCVTTTFVNESIGAIHGQHIMCADTKGDILNAVKMLLSHPESYYKMSLSAREYVKDNFDWHTNTRPLINTILL